MKTLIRNPYFQALVGFAVLGLCLGPAFAQTAAAPAPAAPAAAAGGTAINLAPIFSSLIDLAATGVLVVGGFALNALRKKLHIEAQDQQGDIVDAALTNAVHYGAAKALQIADQVGWTHPMVQNQVIAEGVNYVAQQIPATLSQLGITTDGIQRLLTARLAKVFRVTVDAQAAAMAAAVPAAPSLAQAAAAAASPQPAATPNADAAAASQPPTLASALAFRPAAVTGRAPLPSTAAAAS